MSKEQDIREAAATLHEAILAGQAEGYVVTWPAIWQDLPGINISETARVAQSPVSVEVTVDKTVPDDVLEHATTAATRAATNVLEEAASAQVESEIEGMTKADLEKLAAERGVDISDARTKPEIVERLKAAQTV